MSFFSKLFGKDKRKANSFISEVVEEKPAPEPKDARTTLRKLKEVSAPPQKEESPEAAAKETANRQEWKVKALPEWKPGDVILDTYEVEDVISGGMGHVYIAYHKKWNVKLAIKSPNEMMLSDRDFFARILREAESWTELGLHPNIAYCYFVKKIEDVPHIIVEYVDGGNLREWIEDGKCIDYRMNLDLAIQFCHGMEHAHSKGMIHRDIKPENILMTKDGIVKITDFGLVSGQNKGIGNPTPAIKTDKADSKIPAHGLTTLGTRMGTQGYMAPEQEESARDVDERADIFSFGVCLYEMFCGNKPYGITYGIKQDVPDPVAVSKDTQFPSDIAGVLTKCVQWERKDRYLNLKEIRQELSEIYKSLFHEASPYAELDLLDLEADGLNNRGVAYFELGRKEDAIECWEKSLKINQSHLEAAYNLSLVQWRDAKITDNEVLRRLDECENNSLTDEEKLAELKAYIHAERYAPDLAKDSLEKFPGKYEAIFSGKNISNIECLHTMEGHTSSVGSVAITADGRYAISDKNTLRLWDLKTGLCLRTMEGHTDWVNAVTLTPDGRYVISGSKDKTLRLWDLETGQCLRTMEGHTGFVNSVALTPDGRYAVSGSADKTVLLWDLETGQCLHTMEGHTKVVSSVAITADGCYAVSGSDDHILRLWDLKTGECLHTMEGHTSSVGSVAITADSRYAVSAGSWDKTLRLWDLETGQCLRTMEGHTGFVNSVALTPDGRYAVSGSADKTVRLWDLETGQCLRTMEGHTDFVNSVALTPDGRYAVSGSTDKTVRLWDIETDNTYASELAVSLPKGFEQRKKEEKVIIQQIGKTEELYKKEDYKQSLATLFRAWENTGFTHNEEINRVYLKLIKKGKIQDLSFSFLRKILKDRTNPDIKVALTADGRYAVSYSGINPLRLWDLKTGQCLLTMEGHTAWVLTVALTAEDLYAVSVSIDETLPRLWDLKTGQCLRTLKGHTRVVYSVALTADGRYAVSGSADKTLRLWDLETGQCLRTMEGHTDSVILVVLNADGRYAVSVSIDETLPRLWDLETGKCLRTLEGHTDMVSSVALTADGRYAVSGSADKTLRLWDLKTGECLHTMEGHTSSVRSVAITADSRYAVSGSFDKTVRLWDLKTGQCLRTMEGHTNVVGSVAFTPDGRYAVSGGWDHTLRLWEFIWNLEFD